MEQLTADVLVHRSDAKDVSTHTLRQLKQLPVDLILPSHGPAMGRAIIDAVLDDVYAEAHRGNLVWAWDEV